jgi:diacylglycerol kinase family enzyme
MLDICLVAHASRLRLLRILPAAYRGEHIRAREVEMLRAESVQVVADRQLPLIADGEVAGVTPAMITVERKALLVVGAERPGL